MGLRLAWWGPCEPRQRARLQVADAATDLAVLRVAGRLPECRRYLVLVPDEGGDPASPLAAQMLLAGSNERQADASTAILDANCQSIHVSPPAVPRGDQRTEDRAVTVSDEQAPRLVGEESLHILDSIGSARVLAARLPPQLKDG